MKLRARHLVVVAISVIFTVRAKAQDAPAPAGNKPAVAMNDSGRPADLGSIGTALKGNDNFQVQQALESAEELLSDDKSKNASKIADKVPDWLQLLISQRRFDEVDELAVAAINSRPSDLPLIEASDEARIRARLLAGKPQEALSLGKGLYNVCAMPDTSKAIDLISECLYDINKNGDPGGSVKRFKLEQIHGAASTQPSSAGNNILSKVQVDSKVYGAGIDRAETMEDGWEALMGKGNLLLLSGQTKEAQKVFDKAYSLASDKNLPAATEAVARAMRAEDETVGRANGWILSLRPPEQAGP